MPGRFSLIDSGSLIEVRATSFNQEDAAKDVNLIGMVLLGLAVDYQREQLTDQKEYYERRVKYFDTLIDELSGEMIETVGHTVLLTDPRFIKLMEEKGVHIIRLDDTIFQLGEMEHYDDMIHDEYQISAVTVSQKPINVRWKFNTAVAGALGLMLSILVIFIWPYLKELSAFIGSKASE